MKSIVNIMNHTDVFENERIEGRKNEPTFFRSLVRWFVGWFGCWLVGWFVGTNEWQNQFIRSKESDYFVELKLTVSTILSYLGNVIEWTRSSQRVMLT